MDGPLSGVVIAKRLASCSRTARDRAVRALSTWLSDQPDCAVSDADLAKIWKGLFYCFWHADKLPVQADLAGRLAALLDSISTPLAARYFEAFIVTIRREWGGIDFLRLDKFYLLIRRFLHHALLLLRKNAWNSDLAAQMIGILSEKSLLSMDKYPAGGVNYHVAEVFLDEMKDLPVPLETMDLMMRPFIAVLEKSADKILLSKIKINIFDRLLENGRKLLNLEKAGDKVESGSEVEKLGKIALFLSFSRKFFEAASSSETLQGNRKILFVLREAFLKLEKDLEGSGVHISYQCSDNGNSEVVNDVLASVSTEQVEVKNDDVVGDSDEKDTKKNELNKTSDGIKRKKRKSGKNKPLDSGTDSTAAETTNGITDGVNGVSLSGDATEVRELIDFNERLISNLQKQFEKAAAEAGMVSDGDQLSLIPATTVTNAALKKRKREKHAARNAANGESSNEKSVKKVRFSMKSNLVWKPNDPMPPESLRLPPSVTPKGSALKKGVSPGPIRELPPSTKKVKVKASSTKKSRKSGKSPSVIKRLQKLQNLST